jgi:hypothetical protein
VSLSDWLIGAPIGKQVALDSVFSDVVNTGLERNHYVQWVGGWLLPFGSPHWRQVRIGPSLDLLHSPSYEPKRTGSSLGDQPREELQCSQGRDHSLPFCRALSTSRAQRGQRSPTTAYSAHCLPSVGRALAAVPLLQAGKLRSRTVRDCPGYEREGEGTEPTEPACLGLC